LQRFADSLAHLAEVDVLGDKNLNNALKELSNRVNASEIVAPVAFHSYFKLLRAIQGSGLRQIRAAARKLIAAGFVKPGKIKVLPLTPDCFSPAEARLLRQQFCSESLKGQQVARLPANKIETLEDELANALRLLELYAPQANSDFRAITREIIPVCGRSHKGMTFDGCSSLERWGAILVNICRKRTPLVLAETLVHESAHSLLFAVQLDDYLALNPSTDRYHSPLRIDPRPIDGIFHATFVLSYMIAFLNEVVNGSTVPDSLKQEAVTVLAERTKAFNDGYDVLQAHARFTSTGRKIIDMAQARVSQAA